MTSTNCVTRPVLQPARWGTCLLGFLIVLLAISVTTRAQATNHRADAIQAVIEGKKLLDQGTADSARAAIVKFEQAADIMRKDKDVSGEGNILALIADICNSLGEYQKALDYLNRAIPLMRVASPEDEALMLTLAGNIHLSSGDRRKAMESYKAALEILRVVQNKYVEAKTLNNLGIVLSDLGNVDEGMAAYEKALEIRKQLNDPRGQAEILGNIGAAYTARGEYQRALESYAVSLPIVQKGTDRQVEVKLLINIGIAHKFLGDGAKALEFLNNALLLAQKIGAKSSQASALTNIASIYNESDENPKAIGYYAQALAIARESSDRITESHILVDLGIAYRENGDIQKATETYTQALALMRALEDKTGEAYTIAAMAGLLATRGELPNARTLYEQAFEMFKVTANVPMQASTQKHLATIQRDLGDLPGARKKIESSLTMVESLRGRYTNQDFQTKFFATTQEYFSFYIDILMNLHKQEPSFGYNGMALEASERARARSLLDLLVEARADIRQGVDPQLLERERSLQKALNSKSEVRTRMMKGPHTAEEALAAAKEIDRLTAEYQDVQARLRNASPRYAALTQPQPLDLKGIQTNLDKETLLLQYALGDKHCYLWLVSTTAVQSFELPSRKEIEAIAGNYYELLSSVTDPQNKELTETAARLAEILLKPVAAQLGDKRLVIVAEGALQYLPFAALPESIVSGQSSTQPLIIRHELVSLPSVSVLGTLRSEIKGRNLPPLDIAVLADPVFDPADKRVKKALGLQQPNQSSPSAADIRFTDPLPGTRDEAEEIVALGRPNKSLKALDFEANRELALGGRLSQYRYVHFATHGLVDSFHPELSAIVLSLVKADGTPQDGYLRAHEIYNINLSADLVGLSACETALGKEVKGEGLISLTRALMYAGAPRVVASLWAVRDESTSELMVDFYRGMIKQGKRPAEALRAAQIEMLKTNRWSAPHYWAPFVLQGEWR